MVTALESVTEMSPVRTTEKPFMSPERKPPFLKDAYDHVLCQIYHIIAKFKEATFKHYDGGGCYHEYAHKAEIHSTAWLYCNQAMHT